MRTCHLLLAAALIWSSAANAQPSGEPDARQLTAWLTGYFENEHQMATLPPSVSREPALTGDWVNALSLMQLPVDIPGVPGHAILLQWTRADGSLDRHRVWAFEDAEDDLVLMYFYAFAQDLPLMETAADVGSALNGLTVNDLIGYPAGCEGRFVRVDGVYHGRLSPLTCRIVARQSGRTMGLEAVFRVSETGFTYREAGPLEDGGYAFQVPGLGDYVFERVLTPNR